MPPRWPITVHSSTLRTTWMPCRRSQVRSSKPLALPRGSRTTASRLTRAPCGGARPSGSSSCTGSSTRRVPKRFTRAKTRCSNIPTRGSAVTTAETRAARSDVRAERTAVERIEPRAAPPPACGRHEERPEGERRRPGRRREHEQPRERKPPARSHLEPHEIGEAEPGHRGGSDDVCREHVLHGTTSPCNSEIRAGPMPGIASSPSTEVNPPCCCR